MGWVEPEPLTKDDILEGLAYYVEPDVEAALPFARTMLEKEGYL